MEHFTQILRLLIKNWIWLIVLPICSMVMLWSLTKKQPNKYQVESKFLIDFDGKSTSVSGEKLSQQQIYTEFQNTLEIIKSKKLIEKLKIKIAEESINNKSDLFPYAWDASNQEQVLQLVDDILSNRKAPYLGNSDAAKEILAFFDFHKISTNAILDAIDTRKVNSSDFLKITIVYDHPGKTYYFSNLLNELMVEEIEHISVKNIGKQKAVIEELVRRSKLELSIKMKELENLKVNNNIINLDEHTKAIVTYLVELEGTRAHLLIKIASAKSGEASIEKGIKEDQFTKSTIEENKKFIGKKEELYTAQDVKLSHLQDGINIEDILSQQRVIKENQLGIISNLNELSNNAVYDPGLIHTDLTMKYIDHKINVNRLEQEVKVVNAEIERVKQYSKKFAPFESSISTLRDEISTAQKTYLLFLNKLNMSESMELGASSSKLELVDYPEFPKKPLPSKKVIIIGAGGVAVFVLLSAFIIIFYLLDNSIKDVSTFERRMESNVVAAFPVIPVKSSDEILCKAIDLIRHEELKKLLKAIGESKMIAINSLTANDDASNIIECLKEHWSAHEKGFCVTGYRHRSRNCPSDK